MLKSVNDLSLWNTGQKEGIDVVLLNANQPSFQWALRGISDLKQADILGNTETPFTHNQFLQMRLLICKRFIEVNPLSGQPFLILSI